MDQYDAGQASPKLGLSLRGSVASLRKEFENEVVVEENSFMEAAVTALKLLPHSRTPHRRGVESLSRSCRAGFPIGGVLRVAPPGTPAVLFILTLTICQLRDRLCRHF